MSGLGGFSCIIFGWFSIPGTAPGASVASSGIYLQKAGGGSLVLLCLGTPLGSLLGGSGGVLGAKSGPSWMPKQIKIEVEIHVNPKVTLSLILIGFCSLWGRKMKPKYNPNHIKIKGHGKNYQTAKNMLFPYVFHDFCGSGHPKNQSKSIQKPLKK